LEESNKVILAFFSLCNTSVKDHSSSFVMRSSTIILGLATLAAGVAIPAPLKRDTACSPNRAGYVFVCGNHAFHIANTSSSAPATSPDTAQAFANNQAYVQMGGSAATPQGYSLTFQNLHGATSQGGYLGYYTLTSYNTIQCQQYCDSATNCAAFNIYIERDPSVVPGPNCANPASTGNYKCSLWSQPISSSSATNTGQYQADFQVVITASNGYTKNPAPPTLANFTGPAALGGAIQASDPSTYISSSSFNGAYDPSQCAATCQTFTASNPAKPCVFFNSYVVSDNNVPQGTSCAYYSRAYPKSASTNYGQYAANGDYYSVSQSYAYTLAT